jgi:hypothetical protein
MGEVLGPYQYCFRPLPLFVGFRAANTSLCPCTQPQAILGQNCIPTVLLYKSGEWS